LIGGLGLIGLRILLILKKVEKVLVGDIEMVDYLTTGLIVAILHQILRRKGERIRFKL
jgi:hypothetical protein